MRLSELNAIQLNVKLYSIRAEKWYNSKSDIQFSAVSQKIVAAWSCMCLVH